ncbi:MAG TPA: flagellar hook-basal body complex protein FliE [Dyella sp.]|uniref:flagellar hook-basal body complex protein FliE n=1 Tax=Dyella sp. TaxID=1869338 RepID=UPI002F91F178
MSQIDVNSLLSQMRQMSSQVRMPDVAYSSAAPATSQGLDFGTLFKQSLAKVGETQMQAGNMAASFERGDPGSDLASTMVAVQKADLSLRAVTAVRSKLLDAYKDIMNMSV